MPPWRAASCARTWQPNNYVCPSCRHHFITREVLFHRRLSNFFGPSYILNDDAASNLVDESHSESAKSELPSIDATSAPRASSLHNRTDGKIRPLVRYFRRSTSSDHQSRQQAAQTNQMQSMSLACAMLRSKASRQFVPQVTFRSNQNVPRKAALNVLSPAKSPVEVHTNNDGAAGILLSEQKDIDVSSSLSSPDAVNTESQRTNAKVIPHSVEASPKKSAEASPKQEPSKSIPKEVKLKTSTKPNTTKSASSKKARKREPTNEGDALEASTPVPEKETVKAAQNTGGRKSRRKLATAAGGTRKSSVRKVSANSGEDTPIPQDDREHKSLWQVMSRSEASESDGATIAQNPDSDMPSVPKERAEDVHNAATEAPLIVTPATLAVKPLDIPQPAVPSLEYGLDRVLFNPGVYQLQDPLSRVHNFDPYLQKIMPVAEFDFNALKEYKTSSRDTSLASLAQEQGKRYIGSTSSMTGTLAHFHFLLSAWRPVNTSMLSRGFSDKLETFTQINRAPNAMFLRCKNGTYAIDADKEYDSGNVLMLLGKSMEKLLTMPTSEYERYRKSDPREVSEEERTSPEAYAYTTMGDFLMRSQLDAYDPRLPGTGMFDLKTRAVLSVRMDADDFKPMTGYEIQSLHGRFGSYEREYYDMIRSTMLKYMLQVRMGRMDGIFVAYHNVERIFGFQYIPVQELDRALHGQIDPCLGDQEFKTSLELLNKVLDKATARFPQQSLRFHFETSPDSTGSGGDGPVMWIFAEPMGEDEIERIQATAKDKIEEFERTMMGIEKSVATPVESDATVHPATDSNVASPAISIPGSKNEPPAPSNSGSTSNSSSYLSTHSDADPKFMESITLSSSQARQPLFAASLACRTRINGISQTRPAPLKPTDVWELEYVLQEWDEPDAMWARYVQMKARRKEIFEKYRSEDEDTNGEAGPVGEITSKQKRDRQFIDFLRGMSARGREFRSKMDEMEAGKTPVVVGQPATPRSTAVGMQEHSGVASVDDYMRLLYSSGRE